MDHVLFIVVVNLLLLSPSSSSVPNNKHVYRIDPCLEPQVNCHPNSDTLWKSGFEGLSVGVPPDIETDYDYNYEEWGLDDLFVLRVEGRGEEGAARAPKNAFVIPRGYSLDSGAGYRVQFYFRIGVSGSSTRGWVRQEVTRLQVGLYDFDAWHIGDFFGMTFPELKYLKLVLHNTSVDGRQLLAGLPYLTHLVLSTTPCVDTQTQPECGDVHEKRLLPNVLRPFEYDGGISSGLFNGSSSLRKFWFYGMGEDMSEWGFSRVRGLKEIKFMGSQCEYPGLEVVSDAGETGDGKKRGILLAKKHRREVLLPDSLERFDVHLSPKFLQWLCGYYKRIAKPFGYPRFPAYENMGKRNFSLSDLRLIPSKGIIPPDCYGMLELLPLPACFTPTHRHSSDCRKRHPPRQGTTLSLLGATVTNELWDDVLSSPITWNGLQLETTALEMRVLYIPVVLPFVHLQWSSNSNSSAPLSGDKTLIFPDVCLGVTCKHIEISVNDFPINVNVVFPPLTGGFNSTTTVSSLERLIFTSVNVTAPDLPLVFAKVPMPDLFMLYFLHVWVDGMEILFRVPAEFSEAKTRLGLSEESMTCGQAVPGYSPLRGGLVNVFWCGNKADFKFRKPIVLSRFSFCNSPSIVEMKYWTTPVVWIDSHAFADVPLKVLELQNTGLKELSSRLFGKRTQGMELMIAGQDLANVTEPLYTADARHLWYASYVNLDSSNISVFSQRALGSPSCEPSISKNRLLDCQGLHPQYLEHSPSLSLNRNLLKELNITWYQVFAIPGQVQPNNRRSFAFAIEVTHNPLVRINISDDLIPFQHNSSLVSERNLTFRYKYVLKFEEFYEVPMAKWTTISINASWHQIEVLHSNSFANLRFLTVLDLSHGRIKAVQANYLSGKTCVALGCTLDLSDNELNGDSIKSLALTASPITHLKLQRNGIENFPYELIDMVKSLSRNNIWRLKYPLLSEKEYGSRVFTLDLSHNNIRSIDRSICTTSLTEELDYEDVRIYLNLAHNKLAHIGNNAFQCGNVRLLVNLNGNSLLRKLPKHSLSLSALSVAGTAVVAGPIPCDYQMNLDKLSTKSGSRFCSFSGYNFTNILHSPDCCTLYRFEKNNIRNLDMGTMTGSRVGEVYQAACNFRQTFADYHFDTLYCRRSYNDTDHTRLRYENAREMIETGTLKCSVCIIGPNKLHDDRYGILLSLLLVALYILCVVLGSISVYRITLQRQADPSPVEKNWLYRDVEDIDFPRQQEKQHQRGAPVGQDESSCGKLPVERYESDSSDVLGSAYTYPFNNICETPSVCGGPSEEATLASATTGNGRDILFTDRSYITGTRQGGAQALDEATHKGHNPATIGAYFGWADEKEYIYSYGYGSAVWGVWEGEAVGRIESRGKGVLSVSAESSSGHLYEVYGSSEAKY
eukprot:Nk52_evm4s2415 gene=Nk52_evmTU4s2415